MPRWWLLALVVSGCAYNRLGLDVRVEESLSRVTARPSSLPRCAPVVVFFEGDGSRCQEWSPRFWRRFVTRETGQFVFVRPVEPRNLACGTPAFAGMDFESRLVPLTALLRELRSEAPERPLVILGQSAGAHLAMLLSNTSPELIDGVANLGGGIDSLQDVLRTLAAQGTDQDLQDFETLKATLERNDDPGAPMWQRSRAFWHQLFFTDVKPLWRAYQGPLFLAHGEQDSSSVPFSLVQASVDATHLDRAPNVTYVTFPDLGHDLLKPEVMAAIDAWLVRSFPRCR
ncbi:MAG: alpha/beta fold hydrolase [Myxococcaceae bacterium]|nr:alpha/beta fold hydrolase [Myxococcaceae bacterium]